MPLPEPLRLPAPPALVLLDLDGTLTDSGPGIMSSLRHAYATAALPVPDDATLRTFVGPPMLATMLANGVPAARVTEVVGYYREAFAAGGMYENSVYPGVPEALGALRDAGVRLAVATSKPEVYARPIARHFGLDAFLDGGTDAVFGADVDGGPRATKGDVVAYALATLAGRAAGVPPLDRVVMVGDRLHDVEGAREHGIPTVGVAWGYAQPGELDDAGAAAVVASPADLTTLLLG